MRIGVVVHPGAKKARIEKGESGVFNVYINQPANEGKANKAVLESLAKYFKTKKGNIFMVSGEKSKTKLIEILE